MKCLCYHPIDPKYITRYKREGEVTWAIYQVCPLHGGSPAVSPVFMERYDLDLECETAVVQTAAH